MKLIIALSLLFANLNAYNTVDKLFETARTNRQPVLLFFSGSDWCHNCIKMHENVIETNLFKEKVQSKTVFYQADFPQRNKLDKSRIKMNEQLADQYNSQGVFPLLVLIDKDKRVLKKTTYNSSDPNYYIQLFSEELYGEN